MIGAAIDLVVYLLLQSLGFPTYSAKAASFVAGAVAAYFGHKHVTFRRDTRGRRSIAVYCLLYGSTLALNMLVNEGLLWALGGHDRLYLGIAWFVAMSASATTNYVGGKLLIFNGRSRVSEKAPIPNHPAQ